MSGKIDLYNLGESGINVSVSPIHTKPGDLLQCQNAVPDPTGAEGGLRKRGGLAKLNSVALSGAVKGVGFVPFDSEAGSVGGQTGDLTQTIYVGYDDGLGGGNGVTWRTSTNGTSWADAASPASPLLRGAFAQSEAFSVYKRAVVSVNHRIYFVANPSADAASENLVVREWDGTTTRALATIPRNPLETGTTNYHYVNDLIVIGSRLYVSVVDDSAPDFGRVLEVDLLTGAVRQIGEVFGDGTGGSLDTGYPYALADHAGRLWVGTQDGDVLDDLAGRVYWIRPGVDETWTLDHTTAVGQGAIVTLQSHAGLLYAGTTGTNAVISGDKRALILRRSTAGAWSTSDTGPTGSASYVGHYAGLTTFGSNLYAFYSVRDASGLVRAFNGTSWSTDKNFFVDFGSSSTNFYLSQMLVLGSVLYAVFGNGGGFGTGSTVATAVYRRSGGTWAAVHSITNPDSPRHLGFIRS